MTQSDRTSKINEYYRNKEREEFKIKLQKIDDDIK